VDKLAIVTGAFGALGTAVARYLRDTGWQLALIDSAASTPDSSQRDFGKELLIAGVDLAKWPQAQAAVAAVVAQRGRVDALVNIAGGFRWERIQDGDPAAWDAMYETNLKTTFHTCKAAIPSLIAQAAGRIVNIGAAAAGKAALGMGPYAASKAAVLRLTEALADELKDRGTTVNALLPGIIDTAANRQAMPEADFARWVSPSSVAKVIGFLLSEDSQPITGAGIPVTGRL
jgi:NAD(P)-dependent dehydrogenase (short-subunit alcohol dehydrogenase family)